MPERPDHFVYSWITILPDSMRFFLAATRFYQSLLEEEIDRIKSDDLFSEIMTESDLASTDVQKEAKRFCEMGDRLKAKISEAPNAWDYDLMLRHQDVRVLKALSIHYLPHIQERRNR